jgi:hypothetical protein
MSITGYIAPEGSIFEGRLTGYGREQHAGLQAPAFHKFKKNIYSVS